jgi:hypothetical protein
MAPDLIAELHRLLQEWRRLAEAEGEAISDGNWALAQDCQCALAKLRARYDEFRQSNGNSPDVSTTASEQRDFPFRAELLDLIEIEQRNLHRVTERQGGLRQLLAQADLNQRRLRQIRCSYANPEEPGGGCPLVAKPSIQGDDRLLPTGTPLLASFA